MTGGTQKNIWGAQINLTLIFEREDLKKGLYPGRLPSFGAQGGIFIAWRGAAKSNGADVASCPQIQGSRPIFKKSSLERNPRLSLGVHSCFSSWNEILLTFRGAQAVFLGDAGPEITSIAPGLLLSFGHNPRLGSTILALGGTSSDVGEHGPKMPSVTPGL